MACSSKLRTCVIWACAIPLIILVIVLFLATIALGVNGSTPQQQMLDDGMEQNEFIYWLTGATVCGIVFAFVATFGLCMLEYAIYRITKHLPEDNTDGGQGQQMMLQELPSVGSGDADASSPMTVHHDPTPPADHKVCLDTLESRGDVGIFEKNKRVKLKKLTANKDGIGALFMLFLSCLSFILAILCLLWAIAVGYNRSRRVTIEVTPFVVVEILVAIIFPILLFVSGIFMAIVLNYVTDGAIDGREALPHILRNIKFKRGKDSDFWIIVDSFYFKLSRRKQLKEGGLEGTGEQEADPSQHGIGYSCYPNSATWILVILSGLTIILAVSYFVDVTLDTQVTVNACNDSRIDRDFNCFNASTLAFVDCVDDVNAELLHCFKFYQFGVDVDLFSSLAGAFAFYLVAVTAISNVFHVMKIFLHLYYSKLWGILFIVAGIIAFIGVVIVISIWAAGYISAFIGELPRLNIINLSQMVITCLFIILIGVLIVSSTWVEKTPLKDVKSGKEGEGGEVAARVPTPDKEDA